MLRKELIQILRDRGALIFILMVPVFQMGLFGVIDMNVKQCPPRCWTRATAPRAEP